MFGILKSLLNVQFFPWRTCQDILSTCKNIFTRFVIPQLLAGARHGFSFENDRACILWLFFVGLVLKVWSRISYRKWSTKLFKDLLHYVTFTENHTDANKQKSSISIATSLVAQ